MTPNEVAHIGVYVRKCAANQGQQARRVRVSRASGKILQ